MSPEAVTTERIYAMLKADVRGGRFDPGRELVIAAIAREYGVSIAPVRDSAQRLVGERLLRLVHGGGFAMPEVTERVLHDLLFWHGQLVRNAVKMGRIALREPPGADEDLALESPEALANLAGSLFHKLALRAGNDDLAQAVAAAGDRLHAIRMKEPDHLPGIENELCEIHFLSMANGSTRELIQALWAYHRRRLRRVRQLVGAISGSAEA